ncbi:Hypothetical_protein [Hexamita inflata]|uniref:Hypothetical_protein n=1 Tax=Hexamita inflata TaxID=28002 RepID=A0AA86P764_9EUKA|nr:Hypothetical protein HINF_LOCUS20578 [Hexamita inflata]
MQRAFARLRKRFQRVSAVRVSTLIPSVNTLLHFSAFWPDFCSWPRSCKQHHFEISNSELIPAAEVSSGGELEPAQSYPPAPKQLRLLKNGARTRILDGGASTFADNAAQRKKWNRRGDDPAPAGHRASIVVNTRLQTQSPENKWKTDNVRMNQTQDKLTCRAPFTMPISTANEQQAAQLNRRPRCSSQVNQGALRILLPKWDISSTFQIIYEIDIARLSLNYS